MSDTAPTQRRVLIAERRLPAYRVPFFDALRERLARSGIALSLAHGEPTDAEQAQHDEGQLPWAQRLPTTYLGRLCWQPFSTQGFDLVVIGHENRLLFNHWLCLRPRRPALAYFGHGTNFASQAPNALRERFKRFTARRAEAWLAYTEISATRLRQAGVRAERITVVNNAIDGAELSAQLACIDANARAQAQTAMGLTPGKTALFIGSLYAGKRIDWLLEAAALCASADAQFRLIVVGDGALAPLLRAAVAQHPRWLTWRGACHGPERAPLLALADVLLLPASVGLAILDGFAAGLPLISTTAPGHGPEIAYLDDGVNGLLTPPNASMYATAIQALLGDPARLTRMRAAARASAAQYTLAAMVERFARGLEAALAARP